MTSTALLSRPTGSLRSRVLRLAELVTTPLLPADYVDVVNPLLSRADLRGRIVAVHRETREAVTLVIQPGRGWKGHTPGQYIRVGIDVDGVRQWRPYSLTSSPDRADGCISITVKSIAEGKVSNHLVDRATAGTVVQLDQATGEFVLPDAPPAKVLFLTAGSGLTPVMGMLRSRLDELDDVVLVHSAPAATDVLFADELRELAASGRIKLIEQHTDADGMLDVSRLASLVPDYAERASWACGPTGLLDAAEQHWEQRDLGHLLTTERFRPAVVVSGAGGTVRFTRAEVTVDADGAVPLLDAGEDAGVLMPSGCRMGICYGCAVPLRAGVVRDLRTGDVTTAAPGDGVVIQTCVSAAAGSCDIDL